MCEKGCQALLYRVAQDSDLILIESVMGLFDGTPSSADLAQHFNIPVLGVIDAKAMPQTFAAVAFGLAKFRKNHRFLVLLVIELIQIVILMLTYLTVMCCIFRVAIQNYMPSS
ncbi:MAG: cobyrinic acid a,c-diamide synthase [Colwellia sp.]|jgi:cobyrinic acid a,c-diamide synthase